MSYEVELMHQAVLAKFWNQSVESIRGKKLRALDADILTRFMNMVNENG